MFKFNKKPTQEDAAIISKQLTAQQWMPVADIDNSIVYRKDGNLLSMLRVQPINLELLSDNENRQLASAFCEALNGEKEALQIFCIGRPVDLNSYLDWLQDKAKREINFTKKTLLKKYIRHASMTASSGETMERRFYIIATAKYSANKSTEDLLLRLKELQNKLSKANLISSICSDDEILDVLSLFAHPVQAAYERVEFKYDLPPRISVQEDKYV